MVVGCLESQAEKNVMATMKNKAAIFVSCLALLATLSACGVEQAVKRNDDRYMQPGALDAPLTGVNDTYCINFWTSTASLTSGRGYRIALIGKSRL
jgi:hypothetical protein